MAAQSQEMETAQKDVPATAGNALPWSLDPETSGRSGSKLVCQSGNVLYHQLSCGMSSDEMNYLVSRSRSTSLTSNLVHLQYELLFCISEESDPSLMLVKRLMEKYPNVDATIFVGQSR
jgi:hypothetical protein